MALMGEGLPQQCREDTNNMEVADRQDKWAVELWESYEEYVKDKQLELTPKQRLKKAIKLHSDGWHDMHRFWIYIERERGVTEEEYKTRYLNMSDEEQSYEIQESITADTKDISGFVEFIVNCYMGD